MTTTQEIRYGIRELVQVSGVPRRTIRYYVQIGLLPPPEGAGRGHYYLPEHLERLVRIRELREQGRSLEEIRVLLYHDSVPVIAADAAAPEPGPPPLPPMELTTRIRVAEGIEVVVSHGARPPTPSQLRALAEAAARILAPQNKRRRS